VNFGLKIQLDTDEERGALQVTLFICGALEQLA
jgi:hypothetical protein